MRWFNTENARKQHRSFLLPPHNIQDWVIYKETYPYSCGAWEAHKQSSSSWQLTGYPYNRRQDGKNKSLRKDRGETWVHS